MQSQDNALQIAVLRPELVNDQEHQDMFFWWLEDVAEAEPEEQEQEQQQPGEGEPGEGEPEGEPGETSEGTPSDQDAPEGEPEAEAEGAAEGAAEEGEPDEGENEGEASEEKSEGEGEEEQEADKGEGEGEGEESKKDADPNDSKQQAPMVPKDEKSEDAKQDSLKDAKGDATKARPKEEEKQKLSKEEAPESAASNFFANGGPERAITAKGSNNVIIRKFISDIKLSGGANVKKKGVHAKKALVALVKAPHTVFDQKKTPKIAPKLYAVIDSRESYYDDGGQLLEQFVETCERFNVQVWRAPKLNGEFTNKNKVIKAKNHVDFAEQARIPKDSVVIFVGDGCMGGSQTVWHVKDMKRFKDEYRPLWLNPFPGNQTCGCAPKTLAKQANWTLINGVTKPEDLRNVKLGKL